MFNHRIFTFNKEVHLHWDQAKQKESGYYKPYLPIYGHFSICHEDFLIHKTICLSLILPLCLLNPYWSDFMWTFMWYDFMWICLLWDLCYICVVVSQHLHYIYCQNAKWVKVYQDLCFTRQLTEPDKMKRSSTAKTGRKPYTNWFLWMLHTGF